MAFGEASSPCLLVFHFIIAKEATKALGQPTMCLGHSNGSMRTCRVVMK